MSDVPFGNLFKKLSNLENQFKEIDAKLEKFQKATESAAKRAETAGQKLTKNADQKLAKLDRITKTISDKLDTEKNQ